jgi:ketosteroid isomerase-like protein
MLIFNRLAALALCLWLTTAAWSEESSDKSLAMATTQKACDALRTGDIAAIRKLLAPDFVLIGSDTQMQSRDAIIAEVRRGDPDYQVFRNHSMTARIYGDTAMVWGITTVKGSAGGQPFALDLRFTDTLIRTDGSWRMVASQANRIPAKTPPL